MIQCSSFQVVAFLTNSSCRNLVPTLCHLVSKLTRYRWSFLGWNPFNCLSEDMYRCCDSPRWHRWDSEIVKLFQLSLLFGDGVLTTVIIGGIFIYNMYTSITILYICVMIYIYICVCVMLYLSIYTRYVTIYPSCSVSSWQSAGSLRALVVQGSSLQRSMPRWCPTSCVLARR